MQKRIAIQIIFLGTFFLMQPLCAADGMNFPDIIGTPSSSQMREIKKFLLTNPTDQELQAYTRKAAPFMGARDESSEHAKLGAMFKRLKNVAEVEASRDQLKQDLLEARQQIEAMKQAQKKDGHTPSAAVHDQKANEADSAQITLLKRNAVRAKIVIGCMSAFIIVDKVVIPIIRKCRSAWRDRHDKHKRADAWTALRTRFQKAQK